MMNAKNVIVLNPAMDINSHLQRNNTVLILSSKWRDEIGKYLAVWSEVAARDVLFWLIGERWRLKNTILPFQVGPGNCASEIERWRSPSVFLLDSYVYG